MRKLLGKPATNPSGADHNNPDTSPSPISLPAVHRPTKSQNAVYAAGAPITSLDVAADRRAVVLGGPYVLKTVIPEDPSSFDFKFSEGVDVRAHITAQPSSGAKAPATPDQLNIRDVKFQGNNTIFTACANGKIFTYDLARLSVGGSEALDYIQMHEDSRQVNSLDVNPHLKSWLLSGSQDGMVRVFDTSGPWQNRSGYVTFRQRFNPLRCNEPIKQVRWSPRVGHEMACCTDAGVILKWDVRQSGRPLLKINAHEKACSTIAWHPDGIHLISGGADLKLHVWDLGPNADKRQKPKWTISTPAPVATAAWRPGLWSASAQSRRAAQVAVTYDDTGARRYGTSVVQLWDLARPTMPYKEIERFNSSPTTLSWQNQDMLWTAGPDGMFNQCDVAYAPNVIDRQSTSTMAFSPRGDVVMFLDERLARRRSRPHVFHESESNSRSAYGSSPTTPMLSLSKSDSEEDIIGSFLGPRRRDRYHHRRASTRSTQSMSTTPPSGPLMPETAKQSMDLEQSVKFTGYFKLQQTMASGHVPAAKTVESYGYLSSVYLETINSDLPLTEGGKPLFERITSIMELFAKAAENLSQFRLSQTWRVLAFAMGLLLTQRAQYHLQWRLARLQVMKDQKPKFEPNESRSRYKHGYGDGEATPRQGSRLLENFDEKYPAGRSFVSDDIDSTSNVATPVARPADHADGVEYQDHVYHHGKRLSPIIEPESLSLGPAAQGPFAKESPRRRLDSAPISLMSQESEQSHLSSTEGYDFYDTDALANAIDVPSSNNDSSDWHAEKARTATRNGSVVSRHDSGDSFGQLFSISDGTKRASLPQRPSLRDTTRNSSQSRKGSNASQKTAERRDGSQARRKGSVEVGTNTTISDSPEDIFMISQTTAGSDSIEPSQSSLSQTDSELQDVPGQLQAQSPVTTTPSEASPVKTRPPPWFDTCREIIDTDYLPWPEDPSYPFPVFTLGSKAAQTRSRTPLDPYTLVRRALEFECKTSALNASAIILLLKPLLPDNVIDSNHGSAILRQHHSRLMRMGLFVEATLLRKMCVEGWPTGLPDWGEDYEVIYAPAQKDVYVHFFCANCKKPKDEEMPIHDDGLWTCSNCQDVMAPCAVCGHRDPQLAAALPDDSMKVSVDDWLLGWWQCPGCFHGGHASCLQIWHSTTSTTGVDPFSDGCCPLDGCAHACLPGRYRGELSAARAEELSRAAVPRSSLDEVSTPMSSRPSSGRNSPRLRGSVRSDGNDVPQSRAVGMAREALNKGAATPGGILSSSPGRATVPGERERRKSVKFAKPDRS